MQPSLRTAATALAPILLTCLTACQEHDAASRGALAPPPPDSRIEFTEVPDAAGLGHTGPSYTAAVADVDQDGWMDVALSRHRQLVLHMNRSGLFDTRELTGGDVHGLSWLDWNHDGRPDLYAARGSNRGRGPGRGNALFVNTAGQLEEVVLQEPALNEGGRGRSSTPWDLDNDGTLEVFLLNYQTRQRLIAGPDRGQDLAEANAWEDIPAETWTATVAAPGAPVTFVTGGNGGGRLFRLDEGRFDDVTRQLGIPAFSGATVSHAVPLDADNDGDQDLYFVLAGRVNQGVRQIDGRVFFKFTSPRRLDSGLSLRIDGGFSATLLAEGARRHDRARFGNGEVMTSFPVTVTADDERLTPAGRLPDLETPGIVLWRDRDGLIRLDFRADRQQLQAATGWLQANGGRVELVDSYGIPDDDPGRPNRLFIHTDDGYEDATDGSGVDDAGAGQEAVAADFDNDGDLDIYVVNGRNVFGNPPNALLENLGSGQFRALEDDVLSGSVLGRGASVVDFDYDQDGDIDLLITNGSGPAPGNEGPVQLLRNDTQGGNWLQVRLQATRSNRMALGARVILETNGRRQVREVNAATGRVATSWKPVHFGVGEATAGRLTVDWPSGARSRQDVATNQYVTIREPGLGNE